VRKSAHQEVLREEVLRACLNSREPCPLYEAHTKLGCNTREAWERAAHGLQFHAANLEGREREIWSLLLVAERLSFSSPTDDTWFELRTAMERIVARCIVASSLPKPPKKNERVPECHNGTKQKKGRNGPRTRPRPSRVRA
jgi:hypothetical protein